MNNADMIGLAITPSPNDVFSTSRRSIKPAYLEALTLLERLQRRLQDVVKDEFDRQGNGELTATQALLIYNIGDQELSASELKNRGYYLGSNVSYNLKKLVEMGYLHHQKSQMDKRSVRISLTEKGQHVAATINGLYERHTQSLEEVGQIDESAFADLNQCLQRLERFWTDQIRYRI